MKLTTSLSYVFNNDFPISYDLRFFTNVVDEREIIRSE